MMEMNRKRVTMALVAVVVIAAVLWFVMHSRAGGAPTYRFAAVERGSIQQSVSATGTLSAVKTVQVGTQVSGQVAEIKADFNSQVKKGDLLARIDPTLQQETVRDAEAQLQRAQAQYNQAQAEYNRNQPLFAQKFISASEFSVIQVNLSVALAGVRSAQVTLDRAKQNLSYTNIYAPINGVVVERNVDVGQTVAASLSAPQLFLIAQDLSQMQILASVDESDIGSIKDGQVVKFTVQPYPGRTYTGAVDQVRLQSKMTDNVVSYVVVVRLSNADGSLLPGMTATVEFITGASANVLTVPNLALRYRPTPEELTKAGITPDTARRTGKADSTGARDSAGRRSGAAGSTVATSGAAPGSAAGAGRASVQPGVLGAGGTGGTGGAGGAPRTRRTAGGPGSIGTLYTIENGKLKAIRVRIGLSDGQRTEVTGEGLTAGMQVIVGSNAVATATPAAGAPSTNPLAPQAAGRGGRGF